MEAAQRLVNVPPPLQPAATQPRPQALPPSNSGSGPIRAYGLPAYSTPAAASTTNSPSSKKRRYAPGKFVKRRASVKSE